MNKFNKVTINNVDYTFKATIRSMIAYEQALNKRFSLDTLTDVYTYMFCILVANNENFPMDYEEFLAYLDDNQELITTMSEIIYGVSKNDEPTEKKK